MKKLQEHIIKFSYNSKIKRPKRLENDVFVIYSPKNITIRSGEIKNINMQLKIFLPKYIRGSCRLLLSLSNQKLKLLNSSNISQEYNQNIEIEEIYEKEKYLPPWNLYFELLNENFTQTIKIKNKQELGYFYIMNTRTRGEEITVKYEKEKQC